MQFNYASAIICISGLLFGFNHAGASARILPLPKTDDMVPETKPSLGFAIPPPPQSHAANAVLPICQSPREPKCECTTWCSWFALLASPILSGMQCIQFNSNRKTFIIFWKFQSNNNNNSKFDNTFFLFIFYFILATRSSQLLMPIARCVYLCVQLVRGMKPSIGTLSPSHPIKSKCVAAAIKIHNWLLR